MDAGSRVTQEQLPIWRRLLCAGRSGDWKGEWSIRSPFCTVATATQKESKNIKKLIVDDR